MFMSVCLHIYKSSTVETNQNVHILQEKEKKKKNEESHELFGGSTGTSHGTLINTYVRGEWGWGRSYSTTHSKM